LAENVRPRRAVRDGVVQNAGHEEGDMISEATTKTGGTLATLRTRRGRALDVALWALQILLALQFAAGGSSRL